MDVGQAVRAAKQHIQKLFEDENLSDLGLEEIEHDDSDQTWNITVGFARPWGLSRQNPFRAAVAGELPPYRDYRVVKIKELTGEVVSVKIRAFNQ